MKNLEIISNLLHAQGIEQKKYVNRRFPMYLLVLYDISKNHAISVKPVDTIDFLHSLCLNYK